MEKWELLGWLPLSKIPESQTFSLWWAPLSSLKFASTPTMPLRMLMCPGCRQLPGTLQLWEWPAVPLFPSPSLHQQPSTRDTQSHLLSFPCVSACSRGLPTVCVGRSVVSDSLRPLDCSPRSASVHGISQTRYTGVGCRFLLQGIFPTQGSNLGLLHCRQILCCLSHQGVCRSAQTCVFSLQTHAFNCSLCGEFWGLGQSLRCLKVAAITSDLLRCLRQFQVVSKAACLRPWLQGGTAGRGSLASSFAPEIQGPWEWVTAVRLHLASPSSARRSQLGQSELGSPHVYRVLRDPPEPRHPPLSSPVSGPRRLAHWAHQSDVVHRERAGQQRLGREHPGADEALAGLHKVGVRGGGHSLSLLLNKTGSDLSDSHRENHPGHRWEGQ